MPHVPIYFILHSVDYRRGGLTRNALHRARLVSERTGETVTVLSFDFNPDYQTMRAELQAMGLTTPLVEVRNIFEDLEPGGAVAPGGPVERPLSQEGCELTAGATAERRVLSRDGVPVALLTCRADGSLEVRDDLDSDGLVVHRTTYDRLGRERRSDVMSPTHERPYSSRILDAQGRCYVTIQYDPERDVSTSVEVFDALGERVREYPHLTALRLEWLDSYASRSERSVFQSEYFTTDRVLAKLDRPGVATVKVLHENHLAEPYTYGADLTPKAEEELSRVGRFDAFVAISQSQRDDLARRLGPRTTFHAVPHATPVVSVEPATQWERYTAVCIGRYHSTKRWEHAIEAFARVAERVPQARLELWGFGSHEASLRELVESLGLQEHVFVRGITTHAPQVFARSAFSVLSSPAEGFPIATVESMSVGTPVVAYDVKYGVGDQIIDGVNGVLVEPGDVDALAEAMIDLFEHPEKREALSREARKITERFSEKAFTDAWLAIYDAALEQSAHRVRMSKPAIELHRFARQGRVWLLEGEVTFEEVPADLALSLYVRQRRALVDHYADVTSQPAEDGAVRFSATVDLETLATAGVIWDFYLSCSARNAHRFCRIGVPRGELPEPRAAYRVVQTTYATEHGNLSIKTTQQPRFRTRAKRWVLARLGRA